jgi:monovalent cation:proton antiporter-2 (CPA2) family protein
MGAITRFGSPSCLNSTWNPARPYVIVGKRNIVSHQILFLVLTFLAAAVFAVPLAKRFGLGSILGYLIAGAILGPFGASIFSDVTSLMHVSEFGVVFLLFVIGLELKPARLWVMRRSVFGMGGAQTVITTLLLAGAIWMAGVELSLALVLGFTLSLSSTAFALQYLAERSQLQTDYGRAGFAILLFQDVAVIPVLAALPLVFKSLSSQSSLPPWVGVLVVVLIAVLGRHVTRPIFRMVAGTRSREVFTAVTLLLVLGVAAIMQEVGLSMALGSFLVGMLLSDSEYRHELETDIEPFKGLLLGLFFMSVGMTVNAQLVLDHPLDVLLLLVAYLLLKGIALFVTGKLFRMGETGARHLAFVLIQGSEFGFVLVSLLLQGQVINKEIADLVIMTISLSMAVTPLLGTFNERVLSRHFQPPAKPFDDIHDDHPEVIIAGLGRVGQIFSRVFRLKDIRFTALEQDPEQVDTLRRFGSVVYYGDASRLDLLEKAGAANARYFVLAIDDVDSSIRTAEVVRKAYPHLKIFARARNRQHAFNLIDLGIRTMERETFWSSLKLVEDLLLDWGEDGESVRRTLEAFVKHDIEMLEGQFQRQHDEDEMINYSRKAAQQLVEVMKDDKRLAEALPPAQGSL